jgi:hypothetical protein
MYLVGIAFPVLQTMAVYHMPESPKWLHSVGLRKECLEAFKVTLEEKEEDERDKREGSGDNINSSKSSDGNLSPVRYNKSKYDTTDLNIGHNSGGSRGSRSSVKYPLSEAALANLDQQVLVENMALRELLDSYKYHGSTSSTSLTSSKFSVKNNNNNNNNNNSEEEVERLTYGSGGSSPRPNNNNNNNNNNNHHKDIRLKKEENSNKILGKNIKNIEKLKMLGHVGDEDDEDDEFENIPLPNDHIQLRNDNDDDNDGIGHIQSPLPDVKIYSSSTTTTTTMTTTVTSASLSSSPPSSLQWQDISTREDMSQYIKQQYEMYQILLHHWRGPVLIIMVLIFFTFFTGGINIRIYAPTIFELAGIGDHDRAVMTVVLGSIKVCLYACVCSGNIAFVCAGFYCSNYVLYNFLFFLLFFFFLRYCQRE